MLFEGDTGVFFTAGTVPLGDDHTAQGQARAVLLPQSVRIGEAQADGRVARGCTHKDGGQPMGLCALHPREHLRLVLLGDGTVDELVHAKIRQILGRVLERVDGLKVRKRPDRIGAAALVLEVVDDQRIDGQRLNPMRLLLGEALAPLRIERDLRWRDAVRQARNVCGPGLPHAAVYHARRGARSRISNTAAITSRVP